MMVILHQEVAGIYNARLMNEPRSKVGCAVLYALGRSQLALRHGGRRQILDQ